MHRGVIVSAVVVAMLFVSSAASAQITMPYSVVGCGGGEMSGTNHTVLGTVGQACIGVVSGPSHTNEIGFWYRPGWILTGIEDEGDLLPATYWMGQNHPNPFNPITTLQFALPDRAHVVMKLYDASGREVRTLIDREMDPGYHRTVIEGSGLASGVYFCRMVAGKFIESRKLVLLK